MTAPSPMWKKRGGRHLSWADVGEYLEAVVAKVRAIRPRPDCVVGIARGGLPLAVSLSHSLRVRLHVVQATRSDSDQPYSSRHPPQVDGVGPRHWFEGRDVVVADDIAGDGGTLAAVSAALLKRGARRVYAAVIARNAACAYPVDICALVADDWVFFPWEQPGHRNDDESPHERDGVREGLRDGR